MKKTKEEQKNEGFICDKCGYKAYQLGKYSHCPLCVICNGCNQTVKKCKCIEAGE